MTVAKEVRWTLCQHNWGRKGKSEPGSRPSPLHTGLRSLLQVWFLSLEFWNVPRDIFKPCPLTEWSISNPEAESSVTNTCEMCEDETLFCNYTLQNMEYSRSCELPTWGQYLKVLPCISNSHRLTGGRRCFHMWNGNYFRIISMQHFLVTTWI